MFIAHYYVSGSRLVIVPRELSLGVRVEGDQPSWLAWDGGPSWRGGVLVLKLGKCQTNWDKLVTLVRCKHRCLPCKEKRVETLQAGMGYKGT